MTRENIKPAGQTQTEPRMRMFTLKKAGERFPPKLQKRIHRFYPTVHVGWNDYFKRWMLLERVAGGWEPIALLQDTDGGYVRPNVTRILNWLHKASTRNLRNRYEFEAWLAGFDSAAEMAQKIQEREAEQRIHDGNIELFRQLTRRKIVVPKPSLPRGGRRNGSVIVGRKGGKVQWS